MVFKKLRGCKLSYNEQLLVRAICLNYKRLPNKTKHRINNLCLACGGDYYNSLFRAMTTQQSIRFIAIDENVSESQLYRARLEFYNKFFKEQF